MSKWSAIHIISGKEAYNDRDHSQSSFPANEKCTKRQDDDRYWDGDDGEVELSIMFIRGYDHKELNRKSEEEEEIEFQ